MVSLRMLARLILVCQWCIQVCLLGLVCSRGMYDRVCRARIVVGLADEPVGDGEVCVTVAPCCLGAAVVFGVEGDFVVLTREAGFLGL